MAKKIISQAAVPKARLIISKAKFSQYLNERIAEGHILLEKNVPLQMQPQDSYYGYSVRNAMSPVRFTDEQEAFISEFQKWTDYNSELLMQSFDIGNNEYQANYVRCGQSLVISANDDIIRLYKEELKDKIYFLDSLFAKVELLPCAIIEPEEKLEVPKKKQPLLFISHSSADEEIASVLVTMLRTLGFNKSNLFCSSVPGYDIAEGEDIYETLASKFIDYNIYVIFLLSENYYNSAACLNEMGATWVLKVKYSTLICPGFTIPDIKGAVNPSKMAVVLDDAKRVNGKLNQLKDHLIEFFGLPEIEDDTIWENDRNDFLLSIRNHKYEDKKIR